MTFDMAALFAEREAERYSLHTRHLNEQMVRVLKTIGYDVGFASGQRPISVRPAAAHAISTC